VYVYGVVPSQEAQMPRAERGVGEATPEVRVVTAGDLGALVSDVPAGWTSARRADLEAHERVLGEVVARGTVLPMRFGVIMDSEAHVRDELLLRHADFLRTGLERLENMVQMTLKVFYAEEALLRAVLRRHPDLKQRSDALRQRPLEHAQGARIALGRDVAQAVEAQRGADQQILVAALSRAVADLRVEPPASERLALHAQLLVDRDHRQELDDCVRRLSVDHEGYLAFRYVGPVAPYSFADMSLDGAVL
jgi:hypothetical protein